MYNRRYKYQYINKRIKQTLDNTKNTKELYTRDRANTIIEEMNGKKIYIYNGNKYIFCLVSDKMIGYKLGEFAFTRKVCAAKKKKKVKKNFKK